MPSLSGLNKREREIKGEISSLRKRLRNKEVNKKDFDKAFEGFSRELESIAEEKSKLIGLPPMPPPPSKADPEKPSKFGLDSIKRTILGDRETRYFEVPEPSPGQSSSGEAEPREEPPVAKPSSPVGQPPGKPSQARKPSREPKAAKPGKGPAKARPAIKVPESPLEPLEPGSTAKPAPKPKAGPRAKPGPKPAAKRKATKKARGKPAASKPQAGSFQAPPAIQRIEIPVIKETIREVPVVKEVVKEVKVPVVKERKVPVVKTVEVPSGNAKLGAEIQEAMKGIMDLRLELSRLSQAESGLEKDIEMIKQRVGDLEGLKSEVSTLRTMFGKMDFQGLSQDIYDQFSKLKESLGSRPGEASGLPSDPGLHAQVQENASDIASLRQDLTRREEEISVIVNKTKESLDRIKELEGIRKEVEGLKSRLESVDFQGLSKEIYSQFERMNSSIKESEDRAGDMVEKLKVELGGLRDRIEGAGKAQEHIESLDIEGIRRDLESLKQKSQFIEKHIERVDVKPIVDMIAEVEGKVDRIRASSALIIE